MVLRPRLYRRRVVDKAIGAPRFYISILGLMLRFRRLIPKPVLASVAVVVALTRFLRNCSQHCVNSVWKDTDSNALYLSSKCGATILSEDYFVTFQATNLEFFLRAVSCQPVVSYAGPDVAYPLFQGEGRLYWLLLVRAFRVT